MKFSRTYLVLLLYIIIAISVFVIAAFFYSPTVLIFLSPGSVSVNFVTAVSIILVTVSLLLVYKPATAKRDFFIKILSVCVIGIGLLRALGPTDIYNVKLFFSRLTTTGKLLGVTTNMSFSTAINLIVAAIGVLNLNTKRSNACLADLCGLFISFTSLLSITGYLYQVNEFHTFSGSQPMAFITAICFMFLSIGLFGYRKNKGFTKEITSNYGGRKIAGLLIPVTILVTLGLAYLKLHSDRAGYLSSSFSTVLVAIVSIVITLFFIWMICASINRSNFKLAIEIRERKKVEEELRNSNAFLDTVIEHIPEMVFVKDARDLSYLKINKAGEKFLNGKRELLLGKNNYDFFPEKQAAYMNYTDQKLLKTGKLEHIPEEVLTVDNVERWITTKKIPIKNSSEVITHIVGISKDITEQKKQHDIITRFNKELEKQVEERTRELKQSEQRFKSLIENGLDAFNLISPDGVIFYASDTHKRVLGFTPEEMVEQDWLSFVHEEDLDIAKKVMKNVLTTAGLPMSLTVRLRHKEGHYIWSEGTIANLLDNESVEGLVCNFHDISDRVRIENEKQLLEIALHEEQLNRQQQILQATIDGQEKERMNIGMELHDNINQLLGVIKLYIGIGLTAPESSKEMLQKSLENIKVCIKEIKKLSKSLVTPNLNKGLEEAITYLIESCEKGCETRFILTGLKECSNIVDERTQLTIYRITQELITNILKHAKAKNVTISIEKIEGSLRLNIEDDGIGMNPVSSSTGIGLQNIRTRVELLKGSLEIVSSENNGCRVSINIPLS